MLNLMGIPSDMQKKSTINCFALFFKWEDMNYVLMSVQIKCIGSRTFIKDVD